MPPRGCPLKNSEVSSVNNSVVNQATREAQMILLRLDFALYGHRLGQHLFADS